MFSNQRMSALNFAHWPLFVGLEPTFIAQISKVMVYRGQYALIVTKDKIVYALSKLSAHSCIRSHCIGKIEVLCNKDIKTVAFGSWLQNNSNLILTEDGEVYSIGFQSSCDDNSTHIVERINMPSDAKRIVDIACGSEHFLVLAEDGKVYAWGSNTYMFEEGEDYSVPRHVSSNLAGKKVVCISCCEESNTVVTDDGEVYSWGNNFYGQLGVGDNTNRVHPCRLDTLMGIKIVKVACGRNHTLALTNDAKLYVWGDNQNRQLGTGSQKRNYETPSLLPQDFVIKMERIVDIVAISYKDISIAIGETGRIYIWGECTSIITTPFATRFWNIYDALAYYVSPIGMHKPMITQSYNDLNTLDERVHSAFNDSETSDLIIMVENKMLYGHKSMLKIRCSYFKSMFSHKWKENNENIVKQQKVSYEAFKIFLQYLYTDTTDALSVETTIEVLKLADVYCEADLKRMCIDVLQEKITRENVVPIYEASIMYNAEELKEKCFKHFPELFEDDAIEREN